MASRVRFWEPLPLLATFLLILWPVLNSVLVSDEEAALLTELPKDVFCFSRTFEDLTCFWDEPIGATQVHQAYRFFYTYKGEQHRECMLISERQKSDRSLRHICIFPRDHNSVKLFVELYVEVLDSLTNHTVLSQNLSVETVGQHILGAVMLAQAFLHDSYRLSKFIRKEDSKHSHTRSSQTTEIMSALKWK